jgi:tetratricopeptide (TPR) repeat protein
MTTGDDASPDRRRPYVGLRPFRPTDSQWFAGRGQEIELTLRRWRDDPVSILCGTSGVGKTSLVQAGLLPHLGLEQADVLPPGRLALLSAFPIAALPEHNPYTLALLSAWSPADSATRLAGLSVRDFLRERPTRADSKGVPRPTFVVIDQAEKLFSDGAEQDPFRQAFLDELAEALDEQPGLRLLLSIREDALEDLNRYRGILGDPGVIHLQPLTTAAAIEAVRVPALRAGYSWQENAAEQLVSNIRHGGTALSAENTGGTGITDPDVEPALLQAVCSRFWSGLPDPRPATISWADVGQYGNVPQLLTDFCIQAIVAVADDHGLQAADVSTRMVRAFASGQRGTRVVRERPGGTGSLPPAVVRALSDWHLLKAVRQADGRGYTLQQETLREPLKRARERTAAGVSPSLPVNAADRLRAAEAAMEDGDLDLAERQAAAAAQATDTTDLRLRAEAESLLGNVEHARQRPDMAEARYRHAAALFEALQDTSAVAGLLAAIGQTLLAQGQVAEGVKQMEAAIRRIPNDLTVQTELGRALWFQGKTAAAVAVLTGVLTVDAQAPAALRARGEILAELGEAEKALRDLDRVRRTRWPTVRAARALALATLRRAGAADEEIGVALSDAPDNSRVLLYAARVGELVGDRKRAARFARRAEAAAHPALMPYQLKQARRLQQLDDVTLSNGR